MPDHRFIRKCERATTAHVDLFGEIPVLLDEVLLWMLAVPHLAPTSPRFAVYVRDYNVPDKIRAAKVAGTFEATVSAVRPQPAPAPDTTPRRLTLRDAAALLKQRL